MNYPYIILLAAFSSCSALSTTDQVSQLPQTSKPPLPRTFWPLDDTPQKSQTILSGPLNYCVTVVTTCLNDSAVVNSIITDAGPADDVSHNYESVLTVSQGTRLLTQTHLTKELFQHNQVAQALGPLGTLSLSRTAFVKYRAPEFYFTTRLGVPDSDIFAEAEVALAPNQQLRLVSVKLPEEAD